MQNLKRDSSLTSFAQNDNLIWIASENQDSPCNDEKNAESCTDSAILL
ncbi:hypothetical protein [Helicobacter sp. 23-1045]